MIPTDNTAIFKELAHAQGPETTPADASVCSRNLCQQIRRDLLWAISSTDRWSPASSVFTLDDPQRVQQWLNTITDQALMSSGLPRLQQRRLGHYFEALWLFYLQQHPDWDLRLANEVVFADAPDDKRTIGEIDFVLQHRNNGQLVHLEIAVKFYLAVQHHGRTYWVGPSLQDNLQRKLDHLAHHQLPLGRHRAIVERLKKPPDEHVAIIKGRGFWPKTSVAPQSTAATATPFKGDGSWLNLSDATEALTGQHIALLDRREWLAGPEQPDWQPLSPALLSTITNRAPIQVWLAPPSTSTKPPSALFIVPDQWLEQAKQFIDQENAAGRPI